MTQRIFAIGFLLIGMAALAHGQTSAELRAKYGEPHTTELKNNRPSLERFLVRPNILITIRYTNRGEACEAVLEPVPNSTPRDGQGKHSPDGDYMSTSEVIKLINELVPIETRGKKINEGSMNGGDPEMKLHHPGCWGSYFAFFENASFTSSSWCWGGTFSASIQWGKTSCRGQTVKLKKQ